MASMDSHFHRSIRMEIVCYSLCYRGTSFQYSLIQLYLSLVEIGNLYLNFGRVWYIISQRRKESRYYLFNISKSKVLYCRYTFTSLFCLLTLIMEDSIEVLILLRVEYINSIESTHTERNQSNILTNFHKRACESASVRHDIKECTKLTCWNGMLLRNITSWNFYICPKVL